MDIVEQLHQLRDTEQMMYACIVRMESDIADLQHRIAETEMADVQKDESVVDADVQKLVSTDEGEKENSAVLHGSGIRAPKSVREVMQSLGDVLQVKSTPEFIDNPDPSTRKSVHVGATFGQGNGTEMDDGDDDKEDDGHDSELYNLWK